jgi:GTP 3',8-cyclase
VRFTGGEPLLRRNVSELARASPPAGRRGSVLVHQCHPTRQAWPGELKRPGDPPERQPRFVASGNRREASTAAGADEDAAGLEAAAPPASRRSSSTWWRCSENADEIDSIVAYCIERGYVLRLIELMPMGDTARKMGYVNLQPVKERDAAALRFDRHVVAGRRAGALSGRRPDGSFTVGFITPISQHFCETCNRVRLTVDGVLHLCLGQEERMDFALLRGGASDAEILATIKRSISNRNATNSRNSRKNDPLHEHDRRLIAILQR